jgi:hypothetical protein
MAWPKGKPRKPKTSGPAPVFPVGRKDGTNAKPTSRNGRGQTDALDPKALIGSGGSVGSEPAAEREQPAAEQETGRAKGRPEKAVPVDVSGLEKILLSIHGVLSLKIPEAALSEPEAHALADAAANVWKYYGDALPMLSPKWQAWTELAMVAGFQVYGPRIVAWRARKAWELAERKRKAKEAVNPTPGPSVPPGFQPPDPLTQANGAPAAPKAKGSKGLTADDMERMIYTPAGVDSPDGGFH